MSNNRTIERANFLDLLQTNGGECAAFHTFGLFGRTESK